MDTLPWEIINLICVHFNKRDLKQCIKVSKHWNTIFMRILYKKVNIMNIHQFNLFRLFIEPKPLITHVQEIYISSNSDYLSVSPLEFYNMMSRCSQLRSLTVPSTLFWLDYILSPNMPEMKALSEIRLSDSTGDFHHKLMLCHSKYKAKLTHVTVNSHLVQFLSRQDDIIFNLRSYSQLTHLTIKMGQYLEASSLIDLVMECCPGLLSLTCSGQIIGLLTPCSTSNGQHKALAILNLDMLEIDSHACDYIALKFPKLQELRLDISNAFMNGFQWMKTLFNMNHLRVLAFKSLFMDLTKCDDFLFAFWDYFHFVINVQSPKPQKIMQFGYSLDSYVAIDLHRYPDSELKSISLALKNYLFVRNPPTQFVGTFGNKINTLKLLTPGDDYGIIRGIDIICPLVTELGLHMSLLKLFSIQKKTYPSIHKLTVKNCIIRDSTLQMIELNFPNLTSLQLDDCIIEEDYNIILNHLKGSMSLKLPKLLETFRVHIAVSSVRETVMLVADKVVNSQLLCRWYFDNNAKRTILIWKTEEIPELHGSTIYFTSPMLKKCIFD
ncbi:hypothetical protein BDB01DRAFT_576862 [Pilobolus umbonatus]|nr:hypothetical protein BDB01DRAFT_576862 [Pilobolus umbonatus]